METVHEHIWDSVNAHIGTSAQCFPELIEQLGIMRFGHRPRVADTFCGSGQIPFEAARLGCNTYASDLNPVACMLTWGAFNIVGGTDKYRAELAVKQREVVDRVQAELDELGVESDGRGWRIKAIVYCVESRCPQSGWMVPMIPSLVLSEDYRAIAQLVPDLDTKRYHIKIKINATDTEVAMARKGTIRNDGKGTDAYMIHHVGGVEYRTKVSTLRGDSKSSEGSNPNRLRVWSKRDFRPQADDIFQERPYAILWTRPKPGGKREECELRAVTAEDMNREQIVEEYVNQHLVKWQSNGWLPDMRIEPGAETTRLSRERGWTYWHHLFNPRQLLIGALLRKNISAELAFGFAQVLNWNSRLCQWNGAKTRGYGNAAQTFYNQALNTFFNYGCRGFVGCASLVTNSFASYPLLGFGTNEFECAPVSSCECRGDIFITDPPYGDAVNYDEILEFFIAWFRKHPPAEFAEWTWDSRRSLAIKGDGEDFRREMVAAYRHATERMADNGIQVIMFTHQSGSLWADMANIVWASGLQVTAAWYVVTETDSPLRDGSYVKGTVLLVCRKHNGSAKTTRDDLAWEIQEEVESQVRALIGLNQEAKGLYRDENVFEDADIQMAGYAAALRVLTRYAVIDGRDMTAEAIRPRVKGETTFVDGLIAFAVDTANQCLVPQGLPKSHWDKLSGAERFYLKLLDLEARGAKTLDNYQNFAKAFKVRDFQVLLASKKANAARLKSAVEFGRTEMSEGSELYQSVLRAVLYAIMELVKDVDSAEVLAHLMLNIPDYYGNMTQRDLAVELADYLAKRLEQLRPDEAAAARILRELVKNQRLG
jgi:putative DNA methylase